MNGLGKVRVPPDKKQPHLNDDALTPVLFLKATREEIHEGLHT